MIVIHHLYKRGPPHRLSVSEKNYALKIKNVGMSVQAGPWGVVCGPTVTVLCCRGVIKHWVFKGFKVALLLSALSAIN